MKKLYIFLIICLASLVIYSFILEQISFKQCKFDSFVLKAFMPLNKQNDILSAELDTHTNKDFYLNPKESICEPNTKQSILFVTFVSVAPHFFAKRNLIRETWGNKNSLHDEMRLVFSVGMSTNSTINKQIEDEFRLHKDIVQINHFTDSYFNLTTKIMYTFKWIRQYCTNAKYILRINDDVVVNKPALVNYFSSLNYKTNSIYGFAIYGAAPKRDKTSKFYISYELYNNSRYNTYLEGIFKQNTV